MSPVSKKNLTSQDTKQYQKNKSLRTQNKTSPKKPDHGNLILTVIALVLLVLVIAFLGKGRSPRSSKATRTSAPTIERLDNVEITQQPVIIEFDAPSEEQSTRKKVEDSEQEALPDQNTLRLFFIRVSDEGKISIKSVLRKVESSGSILSDSVNALLNGPRPEEITNDVLSLIPEDSRLLGARIEKGIAFLDFNEKFRFNTLGIEGYRAQIEQLVYTATEFPAVDKVQVLVEGQRVEYLGGEGFWVGTPLGRDDF